MSGLILQQKAILQSRGFWKPPGAISITGESGLQKVTEGYRSSRALLLGPHLSHHPELEPSRTLYQLPPSPVLSHTHAFPHAVPSHLDGLPFASDVAALPVLQVPATGHLLLWASSHMAEGMSRSKGKTATGPVRHHGCAEPQWTVLRAHRLVPRGDEPSPRTPVPAPSQLGDQASQF